MPPDSSCKSLPLTVALFPWGDLIEDFLDTIHVSFETFCKEMTGGWLFGYVEALKLAGIQTIIFCVSAQVTETTHYIHQPTGAKICVLPSPQLHRWVRQCLEKKQAGEQNIFSKTKGILQRPFLALLKDVAPYIANPIRQQAAELRHYCCSAILCQEYEYARFDICILLGKILGLPVFATFQGGNFQASQVEKFIRSYTLRASAGLIVPSQIEIKRLQMRYGISHESISQIFNPLDSSLWQADPTEDRWAVRVQTRKTLQIPIEAKVVVYHGRVELYRKGLDVLMDAWEQLCQDYPEQNWWLLLVGTGPDAERLQARIATLPKSTVRWVNEYVLDRGAMRHYLEAADLYTLPSRNEGFPVAPLEAMACGLPIVAAGAPGVEDILEAGETSGGVVVPREHPEALAREIARLLKADSLRQDLAQLALNRISTAFSLPGVGSQLQTLLSSKALESQEIGGRHRG